MCNIFRTLTATEIEVRTAQVSKTAKGKTYALLLLYKDARCDMNMLDEKFTPYGWQREHIFKDGLCYCTVKIWDAEKQQWIAKEDVGVKSNTEEEKGQASDAFKRACFNVGIGRELYSAPRIVVELNDNEVTTGKDGTVRMSKFVKFYVSNIEYDNDRKIIDLSITDNQGHIRYSMNK